MHFIFPEAYRKIIPPYLPWPRLLVTVSGIAEIVLAAGLLFPASRNISLYGIIGMLVLFLMVHFHMLTARTATLGLPLWLLILRIPIQFFLIFWASYSLR
jgi:uncharacterized membrane protein